jgi:MoaA/NifB/PqqE/SkfB family radical SAM enzyme
MGTISFFLDPYGEVRPCNVMDETMGNIKEKSFEEIWHGEKAQEVRQKVANCQENCWMVGSVSCVIRKYIWKPVLWILRNRWTYDPGKLC